MYRLLYSVNDILQKKYFDDFNHLYFFISVGLIANKTFHVIKIYDLKNNEVFYEN